MKEKSALKKKERDEIKDVVLTDVHTSHVLYTPPFKILMRRPVKEQQRKKRNGEAYLTKIKKVKKKTKGKKQKQTNEKKGKAKEQKE